MNNSMPNSVNGRLDALKVGLALYTLQVPVQIFTAMSQPDSTFASKLLKSYFRKKQ